MTGKVAVITGGSQGIGAGLVTGYRGRGWAVVASALTIKPSEESDLLTVAGDIADPVTADRIADAALDRPACSSPSRSPTTPPTITRWSPGST
jgi:NAD(P)-dependent dehydrogenase (short-subunit alcohol dehydrogenase family)